MIIHKKQIIDAKEHEEEKYQFMKEQIRPQKRRLLLKFVQKLVMAIILALVFGSVAGVTFYAVQDQMAGENDKSEDKSSDLAESAAPEPTSTAKDDQNDSADSLIDSNLTKSDLSSIESYSHVSKKLAAIGDAYCTSLVIVDSSKKGMTWYSSVGQSNESASYGLIFRETTSTYYVLTEATAVEDSDTADVEFYDGESASATVVGSDSNVNLAVIKILKKEVTIDTKTKVKIATMGSTANIPVGSSVIAIGAPNGVMYSVMSGSVVKSDIETAITDSEISLFSTDMTNCSESNGVILNTKGKVIGFINNNYNSSTGENSLAFVDIASVHDIINLLSEGESVAYLGIEGCDVNDDTADAHDIEPGVYVTSVYSSSPAYSGGMRVTDVITAVDDKEVTSLYGLHSLLLDYNAGDKISITVSRKSNKKVSEKKLKITLS